MLTASFFAKVVLQSVGFVVWLSKSWVISMRGSDSELRLD